MDDDELGKPCLCSLRFCHSSFPCAHLGDAVRWLQHSCFLLGRILSAETSGDVAGRNPKGDEN